MHRTRARTRTGGGAFNPLAAWVGGGKGLWLDPSDISTGFEEAGGRTPQTDTAQPTGARLDKRLGLALGSELTTNGAGTTTVGWTAPGPTTLTSTGGYLKGTAASEGGTWFGQDHGPMLAGTRLTITYESGDDGTSMPAYVRCGTFNGTGDIYPDAGAGESAAFGQHTVTFSFAADAANSWIWFFAGGSPAIGEYILIRNVSTKAVQGNHVLQATGAARPEFTIASSIYSDFCDGTDDGYATATFSAGTLGADMTCLIALLRTEALADVGAHESAGAKYVGQMENSGAPQAMASAGSAWSVFVNGSAVGTTNSCTSGQLNTAMGSGSWKVLEMRNLDLSGWTNFKNGGFGSYFLGGDIGGVMLFPSNAALLPLMRRWLGAKVGLSL